MPAPKASAVLQDVFRIMNRGTVLVVGQIEGVINIGDRMELGDRETGVAGIEMVNFSGEAAPTGAVGVLVHDTDDEAFRALIGQAASFHGEG